MSNRCAFCNNAVLEFQQFHAPNGKLYHQKCHETAKATREPPTEEQIAEHKRKQEEEFEKQPKVIGVVEMGKPGFKVDPKTGKKKPTGKIPGSDDFE